MDTRVNSSPDIAKVLGAMADRLRERREEPIDLCALGNGKVRPEAAFEADFVPPGLRMAFGIFDAFRNDAGRRADVFASRFSEVNAPMTITLAAGARP